MEPEIDVLIPVYNRPEFLLEALNSLFRQSHQDFRIVIYDDGSTCTYNLPEDPRITFVRGDENRGVGYARNQLLRLIQAPLVCWQDSDDVSHPERLKTLSKYMHEHPECDMVFGWMYFFHHPADPTHTRTIHRVDPSRFTEVKGFWNNFTFVPSMFRQHLRKHPFDNALWDGVEDLNWVKSLVEQNYTFGVVQKPLYYCRRHPGRLTFQRQQRRKRAQQRAQMREKQRESVVVRGKKLGRYPDSDSH